MTKSNAVKKTTIAKTVKPSKTVKPAAQSADNVETLKTRLIVRPSFDQTIGSRIGNRMRNFNSLNVGNVYTPESVATLESRNFYNPRDLNGKKHNPKNVETFDLETALALQAALEARSDIGATKLFPAGNGKRSIWVAFYADNQ